jgi:2-keto-4-pentenoate hydratase/2-oxohepta-3-ene-1,7-dioic acid hydratase in catechol pathway
MSNSNLMGSGCSIAALAAADTIIFGGFRMSKRGPAITRIFCFGLNYLDHIRELSNTLPEKPVIFMKPASCLVAPGEKIRFPKHGRDLHHEVEIVVRVGRQGKARTEKEALSFIDSLTIGLDLTLRDVQNKLREKGQPWEIAKAFDQSAPMGTFIPYEESIDLNNISFGCKVNGAQRQKRNSGNLVFSIGMLLVELSKIWTLYPGDLMYTGTPSGVGSLKAGDTIEIESDLIGSFSWSIVE